jgi:hypothetical protein
LDDRSFELGILDEGEGAETGKWPLVQFDFLGERLEVSQFLCTKEAKDPPKDKGMLVPHGSLIPFQDVHA